MPRKRPVNRPHHHALRGILLLLLVVVSVYLGRDLVLTEQRVRQRSQATMERLFPGLNVAIDSARAERVFSIVAEHLAVFHENDPDQRIFYAREVRITPRPMPLLRGEWTTGKIVFKHPTFFLQYGGQSNVDYIMKVLAEFGERQKDMEDVGEIPEVIIDNGTLAIPGLERQPYIDVDLRRDKYLPGVYHIEGRVKSGPEAPETVWFVTGSFDADRQTFNLEVDADRVALGDPDLRRGVEWLAAIVGDFSGNDRVRRLLASRPWEGFDMRGNLKLRAEVNYVKDRVGPAFETTLTLGDARLTWDRLPGAVEDIAGRIVVSDRGVVVESVTGNWQGARLTFAGSADGFADSEYNLTAIARGLDLDEALAEKLRRGGAKKFFEEFHLRGAFDAQATFVREAGREPVNTVLLTGRGLRGYSKDFPYSTELLTGVMRPGGGELVIERIRMRDPISGVECVLSGRVFGLPSERPGFDIRIEGERPVPLGPALYEACDEDIRDVWDALRPGGRIDFACRFTREPDVGGLPHRRFDLTFRDSRLSPRAFPMKLRDVNGSLRFDEDHLTIENIAARTAGGGRVRFRGRTDGIPERPVTRLHLQGEGIPINEPLAVAENERLALKNTVLDRIEGSMDLVGDIVHHAREDERYAVDLVVKLREGRMAVKEFPYPWRDLEGVIEFKNATGQPTTMTIESLAGRGPEPLTRLAVSGEVVMGGESSWADIRLRATDIPFDNVLFDSMPETLREGVELMNPRGRFDADMTFKKVQDERYEYSGRIGLKDVAEGKLGTLSAATGSMTIDGTILDGEAYFNGSLDLDRLVVDRKELKNLTGVFEKKDDLLNVYRLRGTMYGGSLTGSVQMRLEEPRRYSSTLKVEGVDMPSFIADNLPGYDGEKIGGLLFGEFRIQGRGMKVDNLVGSGEFRLRGDRVLKYPGALKLLNLLRFSLPADDDFQEALVRYELVRRRIELKRIEVACPSLKVLGSGTIGADGTLNLRFAPESTRTGVPLITDIVGAVSNPLMEVTVKGRIDDPVINVDPMTPVTGPLKMLLGLFEEGEEE